MEDLIIDTDIRIEGDLNKQGNAVLINDSCVSNTDYIDIDKDLAQEIVSHLCDLFKIGPH